MRQEERMSLILEELSNGSAIGVSRDRPPARRLHRFHPPRSASCSRSSGCSRARTAGLSPTARPTSCRCAIAAAGIAMRSGASPRRPPSVSTRRVATVGFTGGTTTTEVARLLVERQGLTIVTNALNIAAELALRPNLRLIVTGGTARSESVRAGGPARRGDLARHEPRPRLRRRRRHRRRRRSHDTPRHRGAHQRDAHQPCASRGRGRRRLQDRPRRVRPHLRAARRSTSSSPTGRPTPASCAGSPKRGSPSRPSDENAPRTPTTSPSDRPLRRRVATRGRGLAASRRHLQHPQRPRAGRPPRLALQGRGLRRGDPRPRRRRGRPAGGPRRFSCAASFAACPATRRPAPAATTGGDRRRAVHRCSYRTARLDLEWSETRWLSDTPACPARERGAIPSPASPRSAVSRSSRAVCASC